MQEDMGGPPTPTAVNDEDDDNYKAMDSPATFGSRKQSTSKRDSRSKPSSTRTKPSRSTTRSAPSTSTKTRNASPPKSASKPLTSSSKSAKTTMRRKRAKPRRRLTESTRKHPRRAQISPNSQRRRARGPQNLAVVTLAGSRAVGWSKSSRPQPSA